MLTKRCLGLQITCEFLYFTPFINAGLFSMGDLFSLDITCACRLHWPVRRGSFFRTSHLRSSFG